MKICIYYLLLSPPLYCAASKQDSVSQAIKEHAQEISSSIEKSKKEIEGSTYTYLGPLSGTPTEIFKYLLAQHPEYLNYKDLNKERCSLQQILEENLETAKSVQKNGNPLDIDCLAMPNHIATIQDKLEALGHFKQRT